MSTITLMAPVVFGVESVAARELRKLGYEDISVKDGKVEFAGDEEAICRSNLWLRSAERVLIKLGEFHADTYDKLFERTKALPWNEWIPENGQFPVKGYSLKSQLHSVPDCQSIIKKAIVEKLKTFYKKNWFEESGPFYRIQFSLMKDEATLMIDTSGAGLHKRGYREKSNIAPLKETLSAALVLLTKWKSDKPFLDPFCGSGTIPIEAALIGTNTAPGLRRRFVSEKWPQIPKKMWNSARTEARSLIKNEKLEIRGSDIDKDAVTLSEENATRAQVGEHIVFEQTDVKDIEPFGDYGYIVCNPPYGERMGEEHEVKEIYRKMGKAFKRFDTWSKYILTPHKNFEYFFGEKADKNRKLYNGMIKCYYYQYFSR